MRRVRWANLMVGPFNILAIGGVVLMFSVASCRVGMESSHEEFAPFQVIWAEAQPWVSGMPEGPSGTRLSFELTPPSAEVRFKSVCYRQQSTVLTNRPGRPDEFSASYERSPSQTETPDQGCGLPITWQNEAKMTDHAVLIYEQDGHDHYFVIRDIVLKPVLAYPGKR